MELTARKRGELNEQLGVIGSSSYIQQDITYTVGHDARQKILNELEFPPTYL